MTHSPCLFQNLQFTTQAQDAALWNLHRATTELQGAPDAQISLDDVLTGRIDHFLLPCTNREKHSISTGQALVLLVDDEEISRDVLDRMSLEVPSIRFVQASRPLSALAVLIASGRLPDCSKYLLSYFQLLLHLFLNFQ